MLYRRLWKSVKIAQDSVLKEALRQKHLYDHKVGAIELQSGDHVLVKLDAFHGQWRKLKNWWGSDLHTMQTRVADGVPTYVVKNVRTGKMKVLHCSRLLLWLADFGEPVRMNCMCTSITLREIPENPLQGGGDGGPVLGCVMFGLNLAKLRIIVDTPESMTCQVACTKCVRVHFRMGPAYGLSYWQRKTPTRNAWAPLRETFCVVDHRAYR